MSIRSESGFGSLDIRQDYRAVVSSNTRLAAKCSDTIISPVGVGADNNPITGDLQLLFRWLGRRWRLCAIDEGVPRLTEQSLFRLVRAGIRPYNGFETFSPIMVAGGNPKR
jgi:hypothetical protein